MCNDKRFGEYYSNRYFFWIIVLMLFGLAGFQSVSYIYLHGDASYYLIKILTEQDFFLPYEPRSVANVLTQLFPVIFIGTGIIDIEWIALSFGFNLHLIPLISLVMSYLTLPVGKKGWIIFAIAAYLINLHQNGLYISHESFVAAAFFWPILYYLLFSKLTIRKNALSIAGILIMCVMHEASLILIFILIIAAFIKFKELKSFHPGTCYALIVATLISTGMVLFWISNPLDNEIAQHKSDFISGILQAKTFRYIGLAVPACIFLILHGCFEFGRKTRLSIAVANLILLSLLIEQIFKTDQMYYPILHWEHRALITLIPALFAMLMLAVNTLGKSVRIKLNTFVLAMLTSLVIILYQLNLTFLWNEFTSGLKVSLSTNQGIIDYEEIFVAEDPKLDQFAFSWSVPSLGLILDALDNSLINSMIDIRTQSWQPWYPERRESWPDLGNYGIEYGL